MENERNELLSYEAPSMKKHDPIKVVQGSGGGYYKCYYYNSYYGSKYCCYNYDTNCYYYW